MLDFDRVLRLEKEERYRVLPTLVQNELQAETNLLANLANVTGILYHGMGEVSWVGFYLYDGEDLVLGPFQGRPACTRIAPDRGICGRAFTRQETVIIQNVHEDPDHIACDARTNSEIVQPVRLKEGTIGVLDIDSLNVSRFTAQDAQLLKTVARILENPGFTGEEPK